MECFLRRTGWVTGGNREGKHKRKLFEILNTLKKNILIIWAKNLKMKPVMKNFKKLIFHVFDKCIYNSKKFNHKKYTQILNC